MSTKLITFLLRVVESSATWTSWLTALALLLSAGTIMLCRERARRQTYREILEIIRPGTCLSDQTRRRSRLTVVRLLEPPPRASISRQMIEGKQS